MFHVYGQMEGRDGRSLGGLVCIVWGGDSESAQWPVWGGKEGNRSGAFQVSEAKGVRRYRGRDTSQQLFCHIYQRK